MPPSVLLVLVNEHLLKDNLALDFVLEVFATVKAERGVTSLVTALKRGQLEGRWVHRKFILTSNFTNNIIKLKSLFV